METHASILARKIPRMEEPGRLRFIGSQRVGYDWMTSLTTIHTSLVAQTVENQPAMQETWVWSLGWEDPQEKGMATHSDILAWRIPSTQELGGLQSMELQRAGHDWATNAFTIQPMTPRSIDGYPHPAELCDCEVMFRKLPCSARHTPGSEHSRVSVSLLFLLLKSGYGMSDFLRVRGIYDRIWGFRYWFRKPFIQSGSCTISLLTCCRFKVIPLVASSLKSVLTHFSHRNTTPTEPPFWGMLSDWPVLF